MKRNFLCLVAALGLFAGLSSCKDFLTTEPSGSIPTEKVLKEFSLLQPALRGVYDGLQGSSSSTSYYGGLFLISGDVRGDDMQCPTTGSRGNDYYHMSFDQTTMYGPWYKAYGVIRRANRLISMCQNLQPKATTDAQKQEVGNALAQAKAIRALVHFDLVRLYAKPYPYSNNGAMLGIPIVFSVPENKSMPGRSTVKEVYDQIIKDFTEALSSGMLEETSYGYLSSSAVKALLARVYLYMGTPEGNTEALRLSKEVIDGGKYALATQLAEYKQIWSEASSKEMIFSIVNFDSKDWSDREGFAYILSVYGYYNALITKKFYDEMMEDPNDIRWNVLWASKGTKAAGAVQNLPGTNEDMKLFIGKYPGKAAFKDMRTNDIPVIRLAEVYLNAAEAAFKLGNTAQALSYLNVIVKRANPAKSVASGDLTLNRILQERAKELVGEGHRFYDLMRNGLRCERFYDGKPGWHVPLTEASRSFDHTYFRTLLPIPKSELDANATLAGQQNPGY